MADPKERLYPYLARRERELVHELAALRSEIASKEIELAHVQRAKGTIDNLGGEDKARFGVPEKITGVMNVTEAPDTFSGTGIVSAPLLDGPLTPSEIVAQGALKHAERLAAMTIKELVLKTLRDHFREGATTAQIREFIRDAYGRVIDPNSLRPQLSRLASEALIQRDPNTEFWKLSEQRSRLHDVRA